MKRRKYLTRALLKPDQLELLGRLNAAFDVEGRALGYVQAFHRRNTERSPYAIPNEFICGELGRFLRLPIPPFAITYLKEGQRETRLFSSLDFNFNRERLPPVVPDICVERLPRESAGVLLFDIWIANEDRHDKNLLVDNVAEPTEMFVFDHDQALFGGMLSVGVDRLDKLIDRLGVTGSTVTGGNQHVFLPHVTSRQFFNDWLGRISSVREWFIEDVCQSARKIGLKKEEADKAQEFLIYRSKNLQDIIRRHRVEFAVTDWVRPGELDL